MSKTKLEIKKQPNKVLELEFPFIVTDNSNYFLVTEKYNEDIVTLTDVESGISFEEIEVLEHLTKGCNHISIFLEDIEKLILDGKLKLVNSKMIVEE